MTEAFKVLRYELIANDDSGRRLIQFTLPGRDFETAEALEAEGLIKREFRHGERTATKVLALRNTRVIIWQINTNEYGRRQIGKQRRRIRRDDLIDTRDASTCSQAPKLGCANQIITIINTFASRSACPPRRFTMTAPSESM